MAIWPFKKREFDLGQQGEDLACKFLAYQGIKILARNYRCPHGEIDIVAFDKNTTSHFGSNCIIFAEVKTRKSDKYTSPASAVNEAKRRKIKKTAAYYLTHHRSGEMSVRYDIVSIVIGMGEPQIEHIQAAFE